MHNYFIVTTERGTRVVKVRIGRAPLGSMTVTEWLVHDKRSKRAEWQRDEVRRQRGTNYQTIGHAEAVMVERAKFDYIMEG